MTSGSRRLRPAAELAAAASRPYPNDSASYREARTALLVEEIELRRHIEQVAAHRRALPDGGEARDYAFHDEAGATVRLADMFGKHDTLVTYFWMYGPERDRPCPMCTSFLGSIDTPARDISQRVAVAVIGRSPVARQLAFARERGWRNLKFMPPSVTISPATIAASHRTGANGPHWTCGSSVKAPGCSTIGDQNSLAQPIPARTPGAPDPTPL